MTFRPGYDKWWVSGPPSQSPGREVLSDLYVDQGLSYEGIARRYGVTRTTVKRWFRAAGIPPRSLSEAAKNRVTPEWCDMRSRRMSGENHPNWRGGVTQDRPLRRREWRQARTACMERDDYTCQDCGATDRRLNAHHIVARRNGGNEELENLVALCISCHHKRERRYADALFA